MDYHYVYHNPPLLELRIYQQIQRLGVHHPVAAIARAPDPSRLALVLDLLREIVAVAGHAVAMAALHRKRLHGRIVVAADVAHEAVHGADPGRAGGALAQASLLQHLLLLVHVLLDQTLLVPPGVPQQDGRRLGRLSEDGGDLFDLPVLLALDLLRTVDAELDLVGLPAGLEILLLGTKVKIGLVHVDIRVFCWRAVSLAGLPDRVQRH